MSTTSKQAFDFSVDLMRALLWQDNKAAKLTSIIQQKQEWYDENQTTFWNNWVTDVFDLRTANQFGLAVWAIILGVSLTVILPPSNPDKPTFGFGGFRRNFNRGNFSNATSSTALLTLQQRRILLQLRYLRLTTRCTVPSINKAVNRILGDQGRIRVVDGGTMTITYVFDFAPSSELAFVLQNFDILPRPAAVKLFTFVDTGNVGSTGFNVDAQNFDNGNFE
jgi:hypothetical protein